MTVPGTVWIPNGPARRLGVGADGACRGTMPETPLPGSRGIGRKEKEPPQAQAGLEPRRGGMWGSGTVEVPVVWAASVEMGAAVDAERQGPAGLASWALGSRSASLVAGRLAQLSECEAGAWRHAWI